MDFSFTGSQWLLIAPISVHRANRSPYVIDKDLWQASIRMSLRLIINLSVVKIEFDGRAETASKSADPVER